MLTSSSTKIPDLWPGNGASYKRLRREENGSRNPFGCASTPTNI